MMHTRSRWEHWLTPRRLMAVSVGVALLTIVLKTTAWWMTDSVGLLSDAMESFVNLAAAMFGLVMITVAESPPDEEHPYGHDKAEYFSSGFEGILIIGAALAIIWAAVPRLWQPHELQQLGWGMGLALLSSVFNGLLAWVMMGASRRHGSIALEADARHLMTDVWTSIGVVLGLALARLTGWLWLDALVAIAVALNIALEGGRLIWRSAQGLMDRAIEPDMQARIEAVLAEFTAQHGQTHVLLFDHVLTRKAGQRRFVGMHMHLPPHWTLERAAQLREQVERDLLQAVPGLYASIQMLPDGVEPLLSEPADMDRAEESEPGQEPPCKP